jgi:hypothetical protein
MLEQLCIDAARVLAASGAGLSVMTGEGVHGMAASSDLDTARIEELQFTLGEGPCIDAFATGRPVLVPDLSDGARARWPVYAPAVHEAGIRAVFAFPLQVGAARLGVLDVLRTAAGSLSRDELGQALTFADRIVSILLDGQERAGDAEAVDDAFGHHAHVFQAQGMVMVQLGADLAEALVRIRAHAYAHNRPLTEVAADIVAGRLRFDTDRA